MHVHAHYNTGEVSEHIKTQHAGLVTMFWIAQWVQTQKSTTTGNYIFNVDSN